MGPRAPLGRVLLHAQLPPRCGEHGRAWSAGAGLRMQIPRRVPRRAPHRSRVPLTAIGVPTAGRVPGLRPPRLASFALSRLLGSRRRVPPPFGIQAEAREEGGDAANTIDVPQPLGLAAGLPAPSPVRCPFPVSRCTAAHGRVLLQLDGPRRLPLLSVGRTQGARAHALSRPRRRAWSLWLHYS